MGDKLRDKMEGGKGMKSFSVHFNLHKPIQIVFFKNFENCKSPFKNENGTRRKNEMAPGEFQR
jgi:hypothetical protein